MELFRTIARSVRRQKARRRLDQQRVRIREAQRLLETRLGMESWERAGNPPTLKAALAAVRRIVHRREKLGVRIHDLEETLREIQRERDRMDARREGAISRLAEEIADFEQRGARAERMLDHHEQQRDRLRDRIAELDDEDVEVIRQLQEFQEDPPEEGDDEGRQERMRLEGRRRVLPKEQENLAQQSADLEPEIDRCHREQDVCFERLLVLERSRKSALNHFMKDELALNRREERLRRRVDHLTRHARHMEWDHPEPFRRVGEYLAEKGTGSDAQKHLLPGILALRAELEELETQGAEIEEEAGADGNTWANFRLWAIIGGAVAVLAATSLIVALMNL